MIKKERKDISDAERRERGRSILRLLEGDGGKDGMVSLMEEVFPDFLKITEERLFGDIWSRSGLSVRDRCMITLALIVEKRYGDEKYIDFHDKLLKTHMRYALNSGMSREEILEVILHVANYTCWGAGYQAIRAAKDVFSSKGLQHGEQRSASKVKDQGDI